jgi:DNA-binding transcriptional regulator YiaG
MKHKFYDYVGCREVRDAIYALNIDRRRLAEALDTSQRTIDGWCSGARRPPRLARLVLRLIVSNRDVRAAFGAEKPPLPRRPRGRPFKRIE